MLKDRISIGDSNMTTGRPRPKAPLKTQEAYNAAVQLYNQEFRTLGERTTAFVIIQSILVAAFVAVLVNPNWFPYAFEFITFGISIVGILFCISHHVAGRSGSTVAFMWRQYMRGLESNHQDAPWKRVYDYCKAEHKKHGEAQLKNLWTRLQCERCLLERSPLPTAWIVTPFIFLMIWFAVSLYLTARLFIEGDPLRLNLFLPLPASISLSIIVSLLGLGALLFIICSCRVWWKTRRS